MRHAGDASELLEVLSDELQFKLEMLNSSTSY
jgi:hypothetical protein